QGAAAPLSLSDGRPHHQYSWRPERRRNQECHGQRAAVHGAFSREAGISRRAHDRGHGADRRCDLHSGGSDGREEIRLLPNHRRREVPEGRAARRHARTSYDQEGSQKKHVVVPRRSARRRSDRGPGRSRRHGRGRVSHDRDPMTAIDPTARVAEGATIGPQVTIGPFCVIGPNVVIGEGCTLVAHVHVTGYASIGPRTKIYPFTSLGTPPQSVKYRGGPTRLEIGTGCDIREHVTMNTGTEDGGGLTHVGDRGF